MFALITVPLLLLLILFGGKTKTGFEWSRALWVLAYLAIVGGVILLLNGLTGLLNHLERHGQKTELKPGWYLLPLIGGILCFLFGVGVILRPALSIYVYGVKERRRERLSRNASNPPS